MKKLVKQLFKREYLMNRLMQIYASLLVVVILLTVIGLCMYTADSNYRQTVNNLEDLEKYIQNSVESNNDALNFIYMELAGSNTAIDNLRAYLNMSTPEYFKYTQDSWLAYKRDTRISETLPVFFSAFNGLEKIYVKLEESPQYLVADTVNQRGRKVTKKNISEQGFIRKKAIISPFGFEHIGKLSVVFSPKSVLGTMNRMMISNGMEAFIFDNANQVTFSTQNHLSNKQYQKLVASILHQDNIPKEISDRYYILKRNNNNDLCYVLLASKKVLWLENFKFFVIIILFGILLAGILLVTLKHTFKRYFNQVSMIKNVTHSVAEGNLNERIDVSKVQDELADLSQAINFMIGSLDQYIQENYELEIKQRDAHMSALQSQINPHFLYNTLEYIRMYALSKQQNELADVVYAFSTLLRNNINQEKTSSLKKELFFCEKYVYLYQMRYPDVIAYNFVLDEKLEKLIIPKFTIQPLIENYFVHGIDYTRNDNAISVKAVLENGDIVIQVVDNGKGISEDRLREIDKKLVQKGEGNHNSIGLHNVYDRLKNTFNENFCMNIESIENKRTSVTIIIKGGETLV